MKNLIEFIEIPSADFMRAVKFYETILGVRLTICDDCDIEKMAFFGDGSIKPNVAISWSADFHPSENGILIHFPVEDMEAVLELIKANNGKIVREKTKIEAEGMGYFALFCDSEGNTVGLYSEK